MQYREFIKGIAGAATALSFASSALAQTDQLIDSCGNERNAFSPDQRITACTALIQTGRVFGMGLAWAYDNRCAAYNEKNEVNLAVADCNQSINDEPTARAFDNRGNAYYAYGDNDRAITDYTEAIRLNPNDATALDSRGSAYYVKGDYDRAIADYSQVIQFDSKNSRAFLKRGLAFFFAGALPKALADFTQASVLNPTDAYVALWIDIAARRSRQASRLPKFAASTDMMKWPGPIVRLYLGKTTQTELLAEAEAADSATKTAQVCEANFYSGELALQRNKDQATHLFELAAANCPKTFLEYLAANAELRSVQTVR